MEFMNDYIYYIFMPYCSTQNIIDHMTPFLYKKMKFLVFVRSLESKLGVKTFQTYSNNIYVLALIVWKLEIVLNTKCALLRWRLEKLFSLTEGTFKGCAA